jgi:hypothetical protein
VLRIRIRDPVPFGPLDPGWIKNKNLDPGSGMNIPDHISESIETIVGVKVLKLFDADPDSGSRNLLEPGSGMEKIRIRDPGSQRCQRQESLIKIS